MRRSNSIVLSGLILGLGSSLLSCSLLHSLQLPSNNTASSPPASPPSPTTSAIPAPAPAETTEPFTVLTAPPLQSTAMTSAYESYACLTANYFMNITWRQDQPKMTFGRRPAEPIFRDVMSTVQANPDGSFTYAFTKEALYYVRAYPDRTCLIQVVEPASNRATFEESGNLGGLVN
jgi:hypothetical protein